MKAKEFQIILLVTLLKKSSRIIPPIKVIQVSTIYDCKLLDVQITIYPSLSFIQTM
jgi:hypothetical protein